MLASLLLNEPFGGGPSGPAKRLRPRQLISGHFMMIDGVMVDLALVQPTEKLVRRVVKAARKLKLGDVVAKKIEALIPKVTHEVKAVDYEKLAADIAAYRELVETVKRAIIEQEEMEFITLLLELD